MGDPISVSHLAAYNQKATKCGGLWCDGHDEEEEKAHNGFYPL